MLDAMHSAVCLPIDRMDPETWLVTLRNRSIPSVAIMAQTVVANDPSSEALKSAVCMVRRQFFKTIVTAVLNAAKRNPGNLKKMRNAIEHDIFESVASCPLIGSQRLVSVQASNLVKILFNSRNYQNMMSGMVRILTSLKMKSFDELVSPAAFSSFLAHIYEHVTRAPISASQRKVEDFLSMCFKPSSDVRLAILSDAFFDGAVETSGGDAAALRSVLDSAPFKQSIMSLENTMKCDHCKIPRFAKSHLYSAPVTHCGICGHPFLTQTEINSLKCPSWAGRAEQARELAEKLKDRRGKHFAEVFGTKRENFVPNASSSIVNLHESVRAVCSEPQFKDLTVPTRELVLAVLAHILDRADPGCPYISEILNDIVFCLSDYLQQRSRWKLGGHEPPGVVLMTIRDRILREVDADEVSGIDVVSDSGLDPELVKQLTAPVEFNLADCNVASRSAHASDDES